MWIKMAIIYLLAEVQWVYKSYSVSLDSDQRIAYVDVKGRRITLFLREDGKYSGYWKMFNFEFMFGKYRAYMKVTYRPIVTILGTTLKVATKDGLCDQMFKGRKEVLPNGTIITRTKMKKGGYLTIIKKGDKVQEFINLTGEEENEFRVQQSGR